VTSNGRNSRHGHLARPDLGTFGRNEIAVLGTTCDEVERFFTAFSERFPELCAGYADAEHETTFRASGRVRLTEGESGFVLLGAEALSHSARRALFNSCSCVVVNGNHHEASRQLIIPNPTKETSLRKRISQLTQPVAIWLVANQSGPPEWLSDLVDLSSIPVLRESEPADWSTLRALIYSPPPVRALILAGGHSVRMGRDKHRIEYNGKSQLAWLVQEAARSGLETWVSCRPDQVDQMSGEGLQVVKDRLSHIGPLSGIASAFMHDPNCAWLIMATDLPAWDADAMSELLESRNPGMNATSFTADGELPEPLAALWEPSAYLHLMQCIAQGIDCPRKVLRQGFTALVRPSHPEWLVNVNTPDEHEAYLRRSGSGGADEQ